MAYLGKMIIVVSIFFFATDIAGGYSASSTNYVLQKDSINFGGGFSSSDSYGIQDTLGEVASGVSTSSSYIMSAGYQAMGSDVYIAMNVPDDVALTPEISGKTGGVSDGSADWAVQTDNSAGYELSVMAATSPALKSGTNSFADYVPSYADPDYSFTVSASESRFGFSPEGENISARYLDNGVSCGSGALDTEQKCWDGFSTSAKVIAGSSAANSPTWATTTILFRAEAGGSKAQPLGDYSASIIVTAVTL